jgi:glycosyltransferase involved in cell wall biosynthesis
MAGNPTISVILTAWNRPQYLEEQVHAVLSQSVPPADVVLWYNQPTKKFGLLERRQMLSFRNAERVRKIICDHNFGIIPRFTLAACLESEYVCIFDDDTIPGARWFANCLAHVEKEKAILGTIGLRYTAVADHDVEVEKPRMGWEGQNEQIAFVDVVGHSWFFRREWARFFWEQEPALRSFGEDIHFCAVLQRHGIRAACPPHPQADRSLWGSLYPERGRDKVAISRSADRSREFYTAVRTEIDRGFKPVLPCEVRP